MSRRKSVPADLQVWAPSKAGVWEWIGVSAHYSITRARNAVADRDRILSAAGIPARWMRIVDAVNGRVVVVKPVGAGKDSIEPPRPVGAAT